jgi:hypothetical protein
LHCNATLRSSKNATLRSSKNLCVLKSKQIKYYLIAGEASGDLHASHLMAALKRHDAEAEFRFFGGDAVAAESSTMVKH